MADNYKIKLTPSDTYFFGGEKNRKNQLDELEMDYYVRSNKYPQQTTLLGLLRYFILTKNNHVFDGKQIISGKSEEAATLIGEKSFNSDEKKPDYGKIKTISPLYFNKDGQDFFFTPMDIKFNVQDDLQVTKQDNNGNFINYNAKDHESQISQYINVNNGTPLILSDIMKKVTQVGNEKVVHVSNKHERDNKFYKMEYYRLKDAWSFCFDATIEDGSGISDKDSDFLPFGGERSIFLIEVKKCDSAIHSLESYFKRSHPYIFCQSDCFADVNLIDEADFAINNFTSFRNFQSSVKSTKKYYSLSPKDSSKLIRGSRYNLLQRGSALYFHEAVKRDQVAEKLTKDFGHYRMIGFNHILTN